MTLLLLGVFLIPLVLAALLAFAGAMRRLALALSPWAALPALLLAVFTAAEVRSVPWLLLDTRLGLDVIGRTFLLFTSLLWTAAGVYARTYLALDHRRAAYFAFHLLTLAGNLGVIVAHDVVTFYFAFALMTFAGYGLVVHTLTDEARRAGRIYLVLAVAGESMLLAGFILAVSTSESLALADVAAAVSQSPWRSSIVALLVAGFGIKAGSLPLHVWLPLAHPVAPTPASAVLSGAIIKAGLLGWLRFLPFGVIALPGWGMTLVVAGMAAAFFGVVVGLTQRDAKTTLAYSSISQIGFMNVGAGIALAVPEAWPLALGVTLAYIVHHGLAKGALFLGVGVLTEATSRRARNAALAALTFAALSLAGAPLTSGGIAKSYLKSVAPLAPERWPIPLELLLGLAALGSTLLMARFLVLLARSPGRAPQAGQRGAGSLWPPWIAILLSVAALMWLLPGWYELGVPRPAPPTADEIWVMIWPLVGGLLAAWLALRYQGRLLIGRRVPLITPGDLLIPVERAVMAARARFSGTPLPVGASPVASFGSMWYGLYRSPGERSRLAAGESVLATWPVTMLGFVLVLLALFAALMWMS